jgi:hypothetical protein
MTKFYLIVSLFLAIIFTSCRKDNSAFVGPTTGTTGSQSESYYPVGNGTQRTYRLTDDLTTSIITSVETSTGNKKTFNSEIYSEVSTKLNSSPTLTNSYIYEKDGVYRFRGEVLNLGFELQFEYLNTKVPVGGTWTKPVTESGTVNGAPARIVCTMAEKDISKVVNGKTFTNVIHTTVELQYDLSNGFETVTTYEFYSAKGVGIIEIDSEMDFFGFESTSKTELISYTIK